LSLQTHRERIWPLAIALMLATGAARCGWAGQFYRVRLAIYETTTMQIADAGTTDLGARGGMGMGAAWQAGRAQVGLAGSYGVSATASRDQRAQVLVDSATEKLRGPIGAGATAQRQASATGEPDIMGALAAVRRARTVMEGAAGAGGGWVGTQAGYLVQPAAFLGGRLAEGAGAAEGLSVLQAADTVQVDNKVGLIVLLGPRPFARQRYLGSGKLVEQELVMAPAQPQRVEKLETTTYHFLEPVGQGAYKLQQTTVPEGVSCQVKVGPGDTPQQAVVDVAFEDTRVTGRVKLKGLPDDMAPTGRPIVQQRSITTSVRPALGQDVILVVPEAPAGAPPPPGALPGSTVAVWLRVEAGQAGP
jgi:hypothetical protein